MEDRQLEKIGTLFLSNISKVKQSVTECCVLIGIRPENMPSTFEMDVILRYLNESERNWTCEELVEAFRAFVIGKLDVPEGHDKHYQTFSPALIHQVLYAYRIHRFDSKKKPVQISATNPMHPDDEDKFFRQACITAFENFKNGESVLDFGSVKYKFLDSCGLIKFSDDKRNEIWEESSDIIRAELEMEKETPDYSDRKKVKKLIENFESDESVNAKIVTIARYRGLMEYFESLVEKGIELKDLL